MSSTQTDDMSTCDISTYDPSDYASTYDPSHDTATYDPSDSSDGSTFVSDLTYDTYNDTMAKVKKKKTLRCYLAPIFLFMGGIAGCMVLILILTVSYFIMAAVSQTGNKVTEGGDTYRTIQVINGTKTYGLATSSIPLPPYYITGHDVVTVFLDNENNGDEEYCCDVSGECECYIENTIDTDDNRRFVVPAVRSVSLFTQMCFLAASAYTAQKVTEEAIDSMCKSECGLDYDSFIEANSYCQLTDVGGNQPYTYCEGSCMPSGMSMGFGCRDSSTSVSGPDIQAYHYPYERKLLIDYFIASRLEPFCLMVEIIDDVHMCMADPPSVICT